MHKCPQPAGFYTQPEVPQFIVHPRSHLLPSNASSVNLTCSLLLQNTTANVPHPQIQWLLNGTAIDEVIASNVSKHKAWKASAH